MTYIRLTCLTCGAIHNVKVEEEPKVEADAIPLAHANGWVGVFDPRLAIAKLFCSDACKQAEELRAYRRKRIK